MPDISPPNVKPELKKLIEENMRIVAELKKTSKTAWLAISISTLSLIAAIMALIKT